MLEEKISLDSIKKAVAYIESSKGDDEWAHLWEDNLHESFILYVADAGSGELSEMAREVLKTSGIEFCRRCG